MRFVEQKSGSGKMILFMTLVVAIGLCGWVVYKANEVKPHCILTIKDSFVEPLGTMNYDFHLQGETGNYRVDLIKRMSSSGMESILKTMEVSGGGGSRTGGGSGGQRTQLQILEIENYFQEPGTEKEEKFRISKYREIKMFRYRLPKEGWVEYILRVQPN